MNNSILILAILVIPTISFAQKKNPDKTPIEEYAKKNGYIFNS